MKGAFHKRLHNYTFPFICSLRNRPIHTDRKSIRNFQGLENKREWEKTANEYRNFLRGEEIF